MRKYDLSILIPSRNEMFVSKTVEELLKNIRGNTEIIVHLDGSWADPGIPDDDRVTIIYSPEPIGQRAGTNKACRLSKAKYVMKLDAHAAVDEGFDVKMMEVMEDDITMVPLMRNLHAFDWVCPDGHRRYQGPSGVCKECGKHTKRDILWKAKESPKSTAFRFDKTLHFQYWNDFKKRPEGKGDLTPTLSLQGSCFMLTREKYWELDICDEKHGSWGQQGTEVACKTWLSGGRVLCNQKTWYAHMFRTQGGDFGFPYHLPGRDVEKARQYSRDLFIGNTYSGAVHDLAWLLQKFYPVPDWHDTTSNKGIIFYTDNRIPLRIAHRVQRQIRSIGLPIVSSSLKPMKHMGKNIHINAERGYLTMFTQILAALEASDAEIIFHCEHDVLYHPSHFDFTPPEKGKFYYNQNWWKVREDGYAVHWDADQVSGLVAYREDLIRWYKNRIATFDPKTFDRKFEPLSGEGSVAFKSKYPNIDIRGKHNLTYNKWTLNHFRKKETAVNFETSTIDKIPGWDDLSFLQKA